MNALKGMKLCYKDRESTRAWTSSIKVDFDKSKHLSETMIKQRKAERERLTQEERVKEVEENRRKNIAEMQKSEKLWVEKYLKYFEIMMIMITLKAKNGQRGSREGREEDGEGIGCHPETTGEVKLERFYKFFNWSSTSGRRRGRLSGCGRWAWQRRRRWRRRSDPRSGSFWSPRESWSRSACWTSCWREWRWRPGPF